MNTYEVKVFVKETPYSVNVAVKATSPQMAVSIALQHVQSEGMTTNGYEVIGE